MIEFKGELSEQCKEVFFRRYKIALFIILNVTWIIIDIPLIVIGILSIRYSYIWFIFAGLCCLIVMLNAVPSLNPQEKKYAENLPKRITIAEGKIVKDGCGDKCYIVRDMRFVKKIIDEGKWYQIIFYFPYKVSDCICQKDLITQGSIEEFEKIFEGLIVKKHLK